MNGYMGDRQHDFADYYTSTPILIDSTIYFGSGEDIYAISISDGFVKWVFKTNDVVHTRPAIYKNKLYAGSFDGNLYAIDINTGSLAWKFKTTGRYSFPKGEVMGNPVIAGGTVIFGARDYNLYAVDTRGGFCSWMKQFPYGWALPVTVNDSVVYVGTSDDRTIYAFNIQTGQEVWKAPIGFNVLGGCAVGKKVGYFCTLAGKVNGLDLATGQLLWSLELDSYKANHLKWLKPDDSYLDNIGKLIKSPTEILSIYKDLGGIFGTPALGVDQLVVAGYDGWVYCFSDSAK
jgi:outer membrane protein assembly factor BamB